MRSLVVGVVAAMVVVTGCSKDSDDRPSPSASSSSGGSSGTSSSSGGSSGIDGATPDQDAATDAGQDAATAAFALTSPSLTEGGSYAKDNTCTGANVSPALAWTPGPSATKSYALVMTDKSIDLVHWVLFDVPASASSLPADIDKSFAPADVPGAKQTSSYDKTRGYRGPCPPEKHTYELALYALDVATLPGASEATTRAEAVSLIQQHDLAVAKLTATYEKP